MATSEYERPFHVRRSGGGFCSGHDTEEQAQASAAERDKRAEALGIKARYVTVAK